MPPTLFSRQESTVWSRSLQRQYSYSSFSISGDVDPYYLSLPLGWEFCFSSSALSSRYIRQRQLHNLILQLRGKRWRQRSTSTFASTRWVGAHCRGYTRLISFQLGPDTMEWPLHLRRSGYGASIFLMNPTPTSLWPHSQTMLCQR